MRPHPILIMLSDVKPLGGAEHSVAYLVRHLDRSIFSPRVLVPREGQIVDSMAAKRGKPYQTLIHELLEKAASQAA